MPLFSISHDKPITIVYPKNNEDNFGFVSILRLKNFTY